MAGSATSTTLTPASRSARRRLPLVRVAAVAMLLAGLAGELVALAAATSDTARLNEAALALLVAAYGAVGLLIVWHRPDQPVGRIALVIAPVLGIGQALVATSYAALSSHPDDRAAALASVTGSFLRGLPWLVAVLWLPLRFPDGRPPHPTRLLRVAEVVALTTITAFAVEGLLAPRLTDLRVGRVDNPLGAPMRLAGAFDAIAGLMLLCGIASIVLAVACLAQKYRRDGALGRQQTLVFGLAFVPPVAAFVASAFDSADGWVFAVTTLCLPVALGVAVLQRRLYDLPLVVNRSLTFGTLSLLIALLYAITVGGVGAMARQRGAPWLPWVAAGVVAVSFAPLRDALQRAANRITYGQWSQPGEVLARTRRRLADAGDLRALLGSLVAELDAGLNLGYVEIDDRTGAPLAVAGTPDGPTDRLPLTAYGDRVGVLRWRRRALRDSDRALLDELAAQLGAVVHAHGLLASVRAAQERLVLAREEERRRLRRDLHDGLGPALAGLTLQVDTARNRLDDPEVAEAVLLELRTGIQETVLDVRRIVEGLRPPALDDLGLVAAVHELAARVGGDGLAVCVEADALPRLPAGVEVAAYRIVQEALANAARHARATTARVSLTLTAGQLQVRVVDDGTGRVVPRTDGVGLGSMRERAEEIGGSFTLRAEPGHGTTVTATLPVPGTPPGSEP
jgi:signal transduction histidine kinase